MRMLARSNRTARLLLSVAMLLFTSGGVCTAQGLSLYTPFTKISVPPGESIDYPIDVINKGSAVRTADIHILDMPKGWTWQLKSGGWSISQVSVLPNEKKSFSLEVQVPLQVNKGTYRFYVEAMGMSSLPLTVDVSQQGTFKSEFTADQSNLAGAANTVFTFNTKLRNYTAGAQAYALSAMTPPGWKVSFKANYKQVSSVNIESGHTQDISIDVDPPDQTPAGTYKIPIEASTGYTSAELPLEVGVTGSYSLQLSTPSGLLSTSTTAGGDKMLELVVRNTGSADLKNIDLVSAAPVNWDVSFDPKRIDELPPGQAAQISATIHPDDKAIAGDYMTDLTAKTPEISSMAPIRVSVDTPLLWSWSGILIILAAMGGVYYLFKKYGRR